MNILVTGDSGLLGSHLSQKLFENGHKVFGISRTDRNHNDDVPRYLIDLTDTQETKKVIEEIKPEVIFHLAANAAEGKGQFSPIDMTQRNLVILANVLTPAINNGLKRFVYTSSIASYGELTPPFKEEDIQKPQDIYGINKMAGEMYLKVLSNVHGFEYVILRPHNIYGPKQNMNDPYRNVVSLFMNKLLKGESYSLYGGGAMKRCFSYIDDVIDVIYKCGFENVANQIFNVGSDKQTSIKELSDLIQKITGIYIEPKILPDRPQEVKDAISDHTKVKNIFGYHDTPLEEGLTKTWAWIKEQGPQETYLDPVEIESKKLPSNWKV